MTRTGETILEVDRVAKLYTRTSSRSRERLSSLFLRNVAGLGRAETPENAQDHWGVKEVSFKLGRGEAIGIIGLNGAGKTTLLRMIAGQIEPDTGEIRVWGQSAAIIALTAGFKLSATGRDNIYLRSAMLGRSREDTEALFDRIVDFSELKDAIDAPMDTYSAGMKLRLAFSILIMIEPDLLVVDETLQVGDFRFRQKCLAKIKELKANSAFVLVSHSMNDISRFCDRVIVMHKGEVVFMGEPEAALETYKNLELDSEPVALSSTSIIPAKVDRPDLLADAAFQWVDAEGEKRTAFREGDPVFLECTFTLTASPENLVVGVPVYSESNELVTGFSTDRFDMLRDVSAGDSIRLRLNVAETVLNPGRYRAAIGIVDGLQHWYMDDLPDLVIQSSGRVNWGDVTLPYDWSVEREETGGTSS